MIDEKEVLKILKRYEGRMNPTAYFGLEADIVNIEALEQEPTTKNDSKFCPDRKAKTTNMEIILHCVEDKCAAYKDGKCLKYNSEQEPTTKNDLGVDAVSRKAVLNTLDNMDSALDEDRTVETYKELLKECYKVLPSVTPQEPRKGHWIKHTSSVNSKFDARECSCCKVWLHWDMPRNSFCPNCGADMREVEDGNDD